MSKLYIILLSTILFACGAFIPDNIPGNANAPKIINFECDILHLADYYHLWCELEYQDIQDDAFALAGIYSCVGKVFHVEAVELKDNPYILDTRLHCKSDIEYCVILIDTVKNVSNFNCITTKKGLF